MAWVKIPAEHQPVFLAALPKDRRVSTLKMFGAVCGTVNGNMFAGLFGRSFMVKLSDADLKEALVHDGAEPFVAAKPKPKIRTATARPRR